MDIHLSSWFSYVSLFFFFNSQFLNSFIYVLILGFGYYI